MKSKILPWKLIESNLVFDTYTKIDELTYELPDGKIGKYYVKRTAQAVCVLAITDDNRVIIAEQFRPGPNKVFKELPGGGIEVGETPEQAIIRELREETGYEGNVQFVTECADDAYSTMNRYCFVATNCKKISNQQLDDTEFVNVELIDIPDFLKIVRSGQMTDVEVALLGLDKLQLL